MLREAAARHSAEASAAQRALEAEREQHELVADRLRQALEEKEHTIRQVRSPLLAFAQHQMPDARCQIARCGPVDAQQPSVCFCTAHAAAASTACWQSILSPLHPLALSVATS